MYVTIWRFIVKPEHQAEFEREYGPDGAWAAFFREGDGYVRTELFRSTTTPNEYVTFDWWHSEAAYEAFRAAHRERYETIDGGFERLTSHEERVGSFET